MIILSSRSHPTLSLIGRQVTASPHHSIKIATARILLALSTLSLFASAEALPALAEQTGAGTQAAELKPPPGTLRNLDFLPEAHQSRKPARPRKFLRRRNQKVQAERDEKYVQLLIVSVGFVGLFIAILLLRSMPPAKKRPSTP